MTADEHQCVPVTNAEGEVIARARVSPDIGEDGMRALASLVVAAQRLMAERDAADPVGAAEREQRAVAAQERNRARLRRIRGEGG